MGRTSKWISNGLTHREITHCKMNSLALLSGYSLPRRVCWKETLSSGTIFVKCLIVPLNRSSDSFITYRQTTLYMHSQCCQLSQIIQETPDFEPFLPVSGLESEMYQIIAEVCHFLYIWNFKYFALFELFYCEHHLFPHKRWYAVVNKQYCDWYEVNQLGQMLQI